MLVDGRVQDGGDVWRHGGVDGRPRKIIAFISPEDGLEEDGGSKRLSVHDGVRYR